MNTNNSNKININELNENIQFTHLKNNDVNVSINKDGNENQRFSIKYNSSSDTLNENQRFSQTDAPLDNLCLDNSLTPKELKIFPTPSELESGTKNTSEIKINPLSTQELIKGIIAKHKRLLDECELEFSILDDKVQLMNNGINSANKNKEATINRVEVLKEKPLQFYNQISKLIGDLSGCNGIDNKLIHSIRDKIEKLEKPKYLLDIDETKQSINEIKVNISKLTVEDQNRKLISTIIAQLDDALEASLELISIHGNDEKFNKDAEKFAIELKGINSRHGWLKNRIESHKKALEYWNLKLTEFETMDSGDII